MADLEARRQARRQKILQNSQKRLDRLYDRKFEEADEDTTEEKENLITQTREPDLETEKTDEISNWLCNICSHSNSDRRQNCYLCSSNRASVQGNERISDLGEQQIDTENKTKECDENETVQSSVKEPSVPNTEIVDAPNLRHRSTVKLQKPDSSEKTAEQNVAEEKVVETKSTDRNVSSLQQFEMFRVLGCVLLAIICRMMLKTGYGLLYFQTLLLPFILLQCALYFYKQKHMEDVVLQHSNNMMVTLLLLCGVKKEMLTIYDTIMGHVTAVAEDLCLFLFVYFISGLVLV